MLGTKGEFLVILGSSQNFTESLRMGIKTVNLSSEKDLWQESQCSVCERRGIHPVCFLLKTGLPELLPSLSCLQSAEPQKGRAPAPAGLGERGRRDMAGLAEWLGREGSKGLCESSFC